MAKAILDETARREQSWTSLEIHVYSNSLCPPSRWFFFFLFSLLVSSQPTTNSQPRLKHPSQLTQRDPTCDIHLLQFLHT